jgi:hypothetical protein
MSSSNPGIVPVALLVPESALSFHNFNQFQLLFRREYSSQGQYPTAHLFDLHSLCLCFKRHFSQRSAVGVSTKRTMRRTRHFAAAILLMIAFTLWRFRIAITAGNSGHISQLTTNFKCKQELDETMVLGFIRIQKTGSKTLLETLFNVCNESRGTFCISRLDDEE